MGLLTVAPTSYAEEQLHAHLISLSTLPVTVTSPGDLPSDVMETQVAGGRSPFSRSLQTALTELTQSTPPSADKIAVMLDQVSKSRKEMGTASVSTVDRAVEAEVITRSVSIIWAHVLQVFVQSALRLDDDCIWWERCLASRTGSAIYLVQSMPERIWRVITANVENHTFSGKLKSLSLSSLHMPTSQSIAALFRPLRGGTNITAQVQALAMSPLALTRSEMRTNCNTLKRAAELAEAKVGSLAIQGPNWRLQEVGASASSTDLADEAARVYGVLCDVLNITPPEPKSVSFKGSKRRSSPRTSGASPAKAPKATAEGLAEIVTKHLPQMQSALNHTLSEYGRPSALVRLWFPFLFLPPAIYFGASTVMKNKEWIKEQFRNAGETVRGFFVRWVWEPVEEIANTMRGGGQGLDFAPETVKADEESLQRMVVDFGRDVYHLHGAELEALKKNVEAGDMEAVLKAYESEIRQPIKNALFGHLIRTLLIQVQKTKTDLSVALQSLDQLLRSQQLTFAFVGVAPSVLLLWGMSGWIERVYSGENRGKARRRRYFHSLRSIEALLLTSPEDDARMSDKDRGALIVTTSGLRHWATGISSNVRQAFLDDLRMFEDQNLTRGDKLHVVGRIWRCWGRDGRGTLNM